MLWVKALHIIAVVCWFAGLFYLPRLFVYHAMTTDEISNERFKIMERRLFNGIMTPSAIITVLLGIWLLSYNFSYYLSSHWMQVKIALVLLLIIYHIYCGKLTKDFQHDKNKRSDRFYRFVNEMPTLLLISIIILVVVKPF